jgi:glycosyltransferase involved in cell wall biosynthesis
VSANRIYVKDGENAYLAGTLGQWEEKLMKLIEEPALRASLGAKARESVEAQYSLSSALPKYLALFERLVAAQKK